ncbi:hypothetical protein SAMN05216232_1963 [Virgibacillus subterraneus]|uniref:Uncharacterized protein n=1 Tax=Virgibacillus subterraneus TaxID=621109 RepID=A0A1H9EB75_9BACI|nr:hypothetical protein [Virgibacillus subterraneus]SEQ22837.1 hypothetical protein SAMN05216232_1963 [Virgibacillus subterraneus]
MGFMNRGDSMKDNYTNLAEYQLLRISKRSNVHNEELNRVWYSRHGMNFPYDLKKGQIINRLTDAAVEDDECDRMILKQAERLREIRRIRRESN